VCIDPPPNLILELGADLVYSPQGSPEFFCPGIPSIATIVDLLHRDYPMTLPALSVAHREKLFAELVLRTDAFQCISDFTAAQLRRYYDVGASRTFRTYIAVQDRLTGPNDTSASAGAPKRPYFLYPANAWAHKNHLTLLVAYRHYRNLAGESAWNLKLTGHDDDAMANIVTYAAVLGIDDAVSYHGHLSEPEFRLIWQQAGALVFPSLHEGFGIPVVEAMHLGVPVLCSNETSLPEIAGDAALLVDARDPVALATAMQRIANDPVLRTQLAARGRERANYFSIEREAKLFLEECGRVRSRPLIDWHRGIHPDGWTDPLACVAIPNGYLCGELEVIFAPMPVPRRVRMYQGRHSLGGYPVAANTTSSIKLGTMDSEGTIVIEVTDAANLSSTDHRIHGVLLQSVAFRTKTVPARESLVFTR